MYSKRIHKVHRNQLKINRPLPFALSLSLLALLVWPGIPTALAQPLQEIVNTANAYANNSNYVDAIPLYEKAVQQALTEKNPGTQTLKNNLAVLYFNHAIALQNKKQYDESNTYLDKSLALSPNQPEALKAKAASFYYQGMDLREEGSQDFSTLKTLFEKAIATDPNTSAYKKALASTYLGEARNLANEQQYEQAAALLETARTLDPEALALKRSLANVYLGLASQQSEDKPTQQAVIDKALALDSSPAIKQRAKQIAGGKLDYGKQNGNLDFSSALSHSAPPNTTEWSIQDKLAAIETALAVEPQTDQPLISRLESAEKKVFGKKQDGALEKRADDMFTTLLGGGGTVQESLPHLIQAQVSTAENTYLDDIFKYTDGRVVRWARFPVRIYIEPPEEKNPLYKAEFEAAALAGMDGWKNASNSFVSYVKVKNPLAADIQIYWVKEYTDPFTDSKNYDNNILKNYTPPKQSKLAQAVGMASMFAPGPFALAPQAVSAGLQYRQARKVQILADESEMVLGLNPTRDLPLEKALILIHNMAAYQFGHTLGLKGISHNPDDLMHPDNALATDAKHQPSQRDMDTLREIYTRPANVVLNIH